MLKTLCLISAGASLGAICRYCLSLAFNSYFSYIALGTLLANLLGGYLIGLALGLFEIFSQLDTNLRFFIITGFLGSFTTFSAFSAEAVLLFQEQKLFAAFLTICLHVVGSLCLTFAGFYTCSFFKQ